MVGDHGTQLEKRIDDLERRALARIVDVFLIGQAKHQDLAVLDCLAAVVQGELELLDDVSRHFLVDLAGELDELRSDAVLSRLPCQIEGIEWNAVSPPAGSRIEAHEAEGLGRSRVENLPDVDLHPVEHDLQLVDEGDIDSAENILQELRRLGRPRVGDAHGRRDDMVVKGLGEVAGDRIHAADDLRDGRGPVARVSGIFAFWREGQKEILSAGQSGVLENPTEQLVRGAGISRRLEDDELTGPETRGDLPRRAHDVTHVGLTLRSQRRRNAYDQDIGLGQAREVGRRAKAAGSVAAGEAIRMQVLDVVASGSECLDLGPIDVETEYRKRSFGEGQRQRQADIAEADDSHLRRSAIDFL